MVVETQTTETGPIKLANEVVDVFMVDPGG